MSMNLPIELDTERLWTLEEYYALPDHLPFRIDLVEGRLRVMTYGEIGHSRVIRRLADAIERFTPAQWQVDFEIGSLLSDRPTKPTAVIPDVVVFSSDYPLWGRSVRADDIALVVEVVSPSTRKKDRMEYPRYYAAAGIPFYWRVETPSTSTELQIFTHKLHGNEYRHDGDSADILKVEEPFPMTIDVPALAS